MSIFDIIENHVNSLRAIAGRVHCPDTEGGKVAAGIKADLLKEADALEATLKPAPVSGVAQPG